MARVECDFGNCFGRKSFDIPLPQVRNLGIKDESSPESNSSLGDFLYLNHHTENGNTRDDNIPEFENLSSDLTLSALTNDKLNQPCETTTDVSLSNLLNGIDAIVCDSDPNNADLSNPLLNSLHSDRSMKLKDYSDCKVGGNFSDLLSDISIQDCASSSHENFNRSVSPELSISLHDFQVPEFSEKNACSSSNEDSGIGSTRSPSESSSSPGFNLSDFLTSICIDNSDQPAANKLHDLNSLHSDDQDIFFGDFNISGGVRNNQSPGFKSACAVSDNKDNFINSLAELSCCDDQNTPSIASLAENHFLSNEIFNGRNTDCDNYFNKSEKSINFSFFNTALDNTTVCDEKSSVSPCYNFDDSNNSPLDTHSLNIDENIQNVPEDFEFSFFPECSSNKLHSNQTFDNIKNTPPAHQNDFNEENTVSMLDLINSLNTPIRSLSVSESSIISCDETGKTKNSFSQSLDSDDDDDILNIDLSMCIKNAENSPSVHPLTLVKTDLKDSSLDKTPPSTPVQTLEDTLQHPLPLMSFSVPENSNPNLKRSLFAKALACKPKKDPLLMQRISNIKCEMFNNIFGRPRPVKCNNKAGAKTVNFSDECVISCSGRRIFGLSAACEVM